MDPVLNLGEQVQYVIIEENGRTKAGKVTGAHGRYCKGVPKGMMGGPMGGPPMGGGGRGGGGYGGPPPMGGPGYGGYPPMGDAGYGGYGGYGGPPMGGACP